MDDLSLAMLPATLSIDTCDNDP